MATNTATQSAILVPTEDDRCASFWSEDQAGDGPTHLMIGRRASDEAIARLAGKFGRSAAELRAFRDAPSL